MKTTLEMIKNDCTIRMNDSIQSLREELTKVIDTCVKIEDFNWKMGTKANQFYVEDTIERCINIGRAEDGEILVKLEDFKGEMGRKIVEFALREEFENFK